jgi:DNA-binding transcriptional MerR regulator
MEIKAELLKPYAEEQRLDFIVEYNHQLGYEIRETETSLQAWGLTEQEEEEKEKERINNLTMTPLDFIKVLEQFGLTLEQINDFLESRLDIKMQLTYCNSVYCGVVKTFLPIEIDGITITKEMVEQAFKQKEV